MSAPTCRAGHPWTESNTYVDPRRRRRCRRCAAATVKARRRMRPEPVIGGDFARLLAWRRQMRAAGAER